MKRKIILILVLVFALSVFAACKTATLTSEKREKESMFVVVETTNTWCIVYHKETRVMYAVSFAAYNCGTFTLLVDADGSPLLWDGGSEERSEKWH